MTLIAYYYEWYHVASLSKIRDWCKKQFLRLYINRRYSSRHTVMLGKTIIKHAAKNTAYQDIMLDALITAIS